jgi:hypothetical protein
VVTQPGTVALVGLFRPAQSLELWVAKKASVGDTAVLARWDHRTGGLPGTSHAGCGLRHYDADGVPHPPAIGLDDREIPVDPMVNSGRWYKVRIQVFPDGRCGIAVNGMPLGYYAGTLPLELPYWLHLHGNSLGNRMLVGSLEAWEGVRTDLDWSALDRPATTPRVRQPPSSRLAASPTGSRRNAPFPRTPRRLP